MSIGGSLGRGCCQTMGRAEGRRRVTRTGEWPPSCMSDITVADCTNAMAEWLAKTRSMREAPD